MYDKKLILPPRRIKLCHVTTKTEIEGEIFFRKTPSPLSVKFNKIFQSLHNIEKKTVKLQTLVNVINC